VDEAIPNFAYNFNLRRYMMDGEIDEVTLHHRALSALVGWSRLTPSNLRRKQLELSD